MTLIRLPGLKVITGRNEIESSAFRFRAQPYQFRHWKLLV
jgi:hypothetical protein